MLRPFNTGELWQGKWVMPLNHSDPNCDRKVTAMMVLGKHMEALLSHAQNTLLVLQGKEKRKWKAEINMSWVLINNAPPGQLRGLHMQKSRVRINHKVTQWTPAVCIAIYFINIQFSILHSAFWVNQGSRGKAMLHSHPHKSDGS